MIRNIRVDTIKLKNKKYKQNHTTSIEQIKMNSKKSFELNIHDTDQYDNYIENIYQRMVQQQSQNPVLVIPKNFHKFTKSKLFKQLLQKIFQYMTLLQQYQIKYKCFAADHQLKNGTLMLHQSNQLQNKCKQISYAYMGVLLSHGQAKFIFKDQYFFETMIYLLSQILKQNFDEEIYPTIDSQLNRIFRTNQFNLIKRRYQQDKLINQYPELQDTKYSGTAHCDSQLINRLKAHKKFHYAMQIKSKAGPTLGKPLDIHQSASKSIYSRSPLIASYFPSERQKLFNFSRQHSVRDKIVTSMRQRHQFSFKR